MTQMLTDTLEQLLQRLPAEMEIAGVPGLALTVIDAGQVVAGQVVATHAVGVKSMATQEAITPDTLFQAASLSKPGLPRLFWVCKPRGCWTSTAPCTATCPFLKRFRIHNCTRLRRATF